MYKLVLLLLNLSLASGFGPKGGGFTGGFGGSIGPGGEEGALFFLLPKKKYSAAPSHKLSAEDEAKNAKLKKVDADKLKKPRFGVAIKNFSFRSLFSFAPPTKDSTTFAKSLATSA